MTESDWEMSDEPWPILQHIAACGLVNDRQLRLFAVASCRRVWFWLEDRQNQQALEIHERLADGLHTRLLGDKNFPKWTAWPKVPVTAEWTGWSFALAAVEAIENDVGTEETRVQADLLRDIIGNPFRVRCGTPAWLTPTVATLAQAAYEERLHPDCRLDPTRLAVLADAMEVAGSENIELITHLRGPGPHVRGCFAVDAVRMANPC